MSAPEAASRVVLRLFIAGPGARSQRTVESVRRICETHLPGRHELEIVDLYQQPALAERDGVVAAPILLRVAPPPVRRIAGDLMDEARVLRALDLAPAEEA